MAFNNGNINIMHFCSVNLIQNKTVLRYYFRFFDKCLQYVVYSNGRMGVNAEHASSDATVSCSCFLQMLLGFPHLGCNARKPVFEVSHQVRHNWAVQRQNMARSLKFWM